MNEKKKFTMSMSKNLDGMPDMMEILELARLLRKNGDKVLSGTSKLSLSTKLLHNLNDTFSIIVDDKQELESSFQVCNSSKIDVFRDIKFLHDFVQKTVWLKVSHSSNDPRFSIDISKFRHVRFLELQKVCIDLVSGIQGVRGQLESITCTGGGGVGTVGRLLAACGRDAGVGFVWASLKRLSLPYNGLGRLDKSLELAPWLQTLDLSHNLIVTTSELDCLPSLKYVNLGYNKLEAAPTFNKATYQTLQVLVLKNNYIEILNGLQGLDCLAELDLSYNCLTEHSVLWPLETMSALLWISLEGNPLSYHKKHRLFTMKHLHSSLSESKFVLDHEPLTKMEKILVSHNRIFMMRSGRSPSKDDLASLNGSLTSEVISASVENSYHHDLMASQTSELMESTDRSVPRNRKKKLVCEAIITDGDNREEDENVTNMASSLMSTSLMETSAEHLETKKQILALRERFGDENWLISHAGSFVQDIMGLERSHGPTLTTPSSIDSSSKIIVATSVTNVSPNFTSNPPIWSNESSSDDAGFESEVRSSHESEQEETTEMTMKKHDSDENLTIEDREESPKIVESPYDPEEEKGELFLVQKKSSDNEIEEYFLVITPEDIKEKDSMTGKLRYRWMTESVLSCVMGRGETPTIDFIFDTRRKDRQNRTYFVEQEDALKIVKTVGELIKARPILLKVFKCMKCSTHFSQDPDYLTGITTTSISNLKPPKCPTCLSTLVIQTDELLTPDVEDVKKDSEKMPVKSSIDDNSVEEGNLQHSESHSSIGGTEVGSMPVTNSLVHFDSRPKAEVSCSATSLEESRESTPSASTVTKRYESDIEILSNPSQSSIEVLDDGTKATSTPNRKRSSEERRVAIAPTLLTIPDTAPVMAGLTESSSSGSLTDSICTTYENKVSKASGSAGKRQSRRISESENSTNIETSKECVSITPVGNLTSMLGGLLQSMKISTNKGSLPKSEEETDFIECDIEYSYEDFASVDHRIKLHLILNVFEQENEKLVMLLRAQIVMQDLMEPFQGCLVLSNTKVYVLRIIGTEGGDPQRWLHKVTSWTNERLRSIAPLPFKQGILLKLHQRNRPLEESAETTIVCILQDFKRTSNLLYCLTGLGPTSRCEFDNTTQSHYTSALKRSMLASSNYRHYENIRFLAFFTRATFTQKELDVKVKTGGLIVTNSALLLTGEKIQWVLPDTDETPNILTEHSISNLIEVKHGRCTLDLSFLDEVAGIEDTWSIVFVSSDAAKAVINAIEPPWEELFSVPLQVTDTSLDTSQE